jgi:hypothetical protein
MAAYLRPKTHFLQERIIFPNRECLFVNTFVLTKIEPGNISLRASFG